MCEFLIWIELSTVRLLKRKRNEMSPTGAIRRNIHSEIMSLFRRTTQIVYSFMFEHPDRAKGYEIRIQLHSSAAEDAGKAPRTQRPPIETI